MTYDLYFHDDFDGWASAAVMLSFFESRGDRVGRFVPVDHDLQAQWRDDDFFKGKSRAPVVLDFPFHPGAVFWFDHHQAPFKKDEWKEGFKEDKAHAYRPHYFSCCHLTYDMLRRNFNWSPPAHFKELVVWLDVIDGARYASAGQTIRMKEPAFAVDNFIDLRHGHPRAASRIIKLLAAQPIGKIAKLPDVAAAGWIVRKRSAANLEFYRKHLIVDGNVTFIDLMRSPNKILRYAPNYLFPKLRYAIRATMKGRLYHLGVGENPWLANIGKIDIGTLMKKYGGGGHRAVGAAEFKTRKELEKARREITDVLNKR